MGYKYIYVLIILIIFCILLVVIEASDDEESLLAELEMLDYEFQDRFENVAKAKKSSLLTSNFRETVKAEETLGIFVKEQVKYLAQYDNVPYEALRNYTLITKPGDILLENGDWTTLVSYSSAIQELINTAKIPCNNNVQGCTFNRGGYENILEESKSEEFLRNSWLSWQELFSSSQEQFPSILDLINKASVLNEQSDAKTYWEYLHDQPDVYSQADVFWLEIQPLYQKLHQFVQTRLFNYYNITDNSTTIPVYLLGTNFGDDWSNIADIILPHPQLHYDINTYLKTRSSRNIFELSEVLTRELSLGPLGNSFWNNSLFNASFCEDQLFVFCAQKGHTEIITCNKTSWIKYLDNFETAMSVVLNNYDYVSYPRRSFRYSIIDEALKGLGSLLAVENLPHYKILSKSVFQGESENDSKKMAKLLLVALRILPRIAYYYAADKWRLQELESRSENITESWWKIREEIQGVTGVSYNESDYLGDMHIISNRPYLYKFLGSLLQFEILRNYPADPFTNIATEIGKDENFIALIQDRPANDWISLINLYYGIYEISPSALIEYFQPLEKYLEDAPLKQEKITTTTTITTTTPKPTISKKKLKIDEIKNKIQNTATSNIIKGSVISAVLDKNETKSDKKDDKSSDNGTMYFGLGVLIGVVLITVGTFLMKRIKKERKKKEMPRNRRFET